tara:strand:- start:29 stop:433 length:405 start_codon:yes stop_codon:yes gene_type:complete
MKNILQENMRRFGTKNLNEQETPKISVKIANEGIKNVTSAMINGPSFPGDYSGYVFGGEFEGTYYEWDASGVDGIFGADIKRKGYIHSDNNSSLAKYGVKDADPNGVCVGFYSKQLKLWCYMNTQGKAAAYTYI